MKIYIPFNSWSKTRILNNTKKATTRYKKYGNPGDVFEVNDTQYELDLVIRVPLWFVVEELYRSEGAASQEELKEVWKSIHPKKGYRPFDLVWYHHWRYNKYISVLE